MEERHIAVIGALAELGGTYLEVRGRVAMRQERRVSDLANDEDDLLDLEESQVRVHRSGESLWDTVPALSLNRAEVLLLMPIAETHRGRDDLRAPGRRVRVKLFCGPLEVTGFITVPLDQSVSDWHRSARQRFLAVTEARVSPIEQNFEFEEEGGTYKFVLINRHRLTALIETRVNGARADPRVDAQPDELPAS